MNDSYSLLAHTSTVQNVQSLARKTAVSRKRKRCDIDDVIHILPDANSTTPRETLRSLCVIKRAQLPLSFLEPSTLISRRFKSSLRALENQAEGPIVLIAEASNGVLHAIEKIQDSQYALCGMATNITRDAITALLNVDVNTTFTCTDFTTRSWRDAAAVPNPLQSGFSRARKAPRLSLTPSSKAAESSGAGTAQGQAQEAQKPGVIQQDGADPAAREVSLPAVATHDEDPQEAFATFIHQYLDILYKSRASVAYFAKAHLSRLRALPSLGDDAGRQKLQEFLEGIIVSSTSTDKKYKKIWPEKLQEVGPALSADESKNAKRAKRAKGKLKANKQGLLANEESAFLHWWFHEDDLPLSNETLEVRFKRRSLFLRTREAFLQIILTLEVLALQASRLQTFTTTDQDAQVSKRPAVKGKDYSLALELLLDKLSIWHSLEHGGLLASLDGKQDDSKRAPDHLRNFCTEVVIPFYIARIPEQASVVNKKLGGPTAPSPARRRKSNPLDAGRSNKNNKENSQLAKSDKQAHAKRSIGSLSRSATDSLLIPGLKREPSEISLESIPLSTASRSGVRSNVLDKMKMRQREVDFDALSQAQDMRRKKQADVDSKLREAISALKKPNRALAGREMADVTEQRERMAQAREKAQKAQKARQRSAIQVDATPKHSRIRTDIAVTPEARRHSEPVAHASASTVSMIPSSGVRAQSPLEEQDEFSIPQTGHRERHQETHATPVRAIKFAMPAIPESGIKRVSFETESGQGIFETPVKATRTEEVEVVAQKTPVQATPQSRDEKTSIYDALGWE